MKKLFAFCTAAILALALAACGGEPTVNSTADSIEPAPSSTESTAVETGAVDEHSVEAIQARGKIVIATESQYAPFAFKDENGNLVGLEPVFMQKIADDLGVELEVMDISFDAVLPAVQSGAADMAFAGFTPTAERKESVEMSDFYNGGTQCMLVLTENLETYNTKESLVGQVIATQKGALQQTLGEEQFPDSELQLLPKFPQCVEELKNGNAVAVLIDSTSAANYVKIYPEISIGAVPVEIDPTEAGSSAALMKGNTDLLNWLNEEIAKYTESGELAQWFEDAQAQAEQLGVE